MFYLHDSKYTHSIATNSVTSPARFLTTIGVKLIMCPKSTIFDRFRRHFGKACRGSDFSVPRKKIDMQHCNFCGWKVVLIHLEIMFVKYKYILCIHGEQGRAGAPVSLVRSRHWLN